MRTRTSSRTLEHFVEVARLIAGDTFPEWLPRLLSNWTSDLFRERSMERHQRPTRAAMRGMLSRFEAAALDIIEGLESPWIREFLEAEPNIPLVNPELIIDILEDLADRANQAWASAALTTDAGATKPGSGKARSVASASAQTYCALLILETWKFFHGAEPRPKNRKAVAAAEAYWRAAGGDPHSSGDEPLASWYYHFGLARNHKAKTLTAEYRRHLVENDRSWKLLHGLLEEAA